MAVRLKLNDFGQAAGWACSNESAWQCLQCIRIWGQWLTEAWWLWACAEDFWADCVLLAMKVMLWAMWY